jgi:hypothetical protein
MWSEDLVVEGNIEAQVIDESLLVFGRAPGSAKQPVHIGPKHRARVIE